MRHPALILLLSLFMVSSSASRAGWFSTDYYVVVQRNADGKMFAGWITEGAPKNDNGTYVFIPMKWYPKKLGTETRIAIQGTTVIKSGSDFTDALKLLGRLNSQ